MVKTDTQDKRLRGQDKNGVLPVEGGKGNLRRKTCLKSGGDLDYIDSDTKLSLKSPPGT